MPWVLLSALALLGCVNDPTVPASVRTLERFTVEVPGVSFATHATLQLKAWGLYSDGSKVDLSTQTAWSSSDVTVGRIGESGIAQLDGVGLARFEARFEDRSAFVVLQVTGAELESLTVSSADPSAVAAGDTRRFTARAGYSDGTSIDVTDRATWLADGVTLELTEVPGQVVGRAEGHGVVRATWFSQQTSAALEVIAPRVVGLTIAAPEVTVHPGDALQLSLYAAFSDGSRRDVSAEAVWTSSDANVADVSVHGAIFARAAGRASLGARWNDQRTELELVIDAHQVVSVGFASFGLQLPLGRSGGLDLFARLDDGTHLLVTGAATWSSSQPGVAEVSNLAGSRGAVTTHAMGNATIRAEFAGHEATWDLEVIAPVLNTLGASLPGGRLLVGQSADFIVVGTWSDGSTLNLSSVVSVHHGLALESTAVNGRIKVTGVERDRPGGPRGERGQHPGDVRGDGDAHRHAGDPGGSPAHLQHAGFGPAGNAPLPRVRHLLRRRAGRRDRAGQLVPGGCDEGHHVGRPGLARLVPARPGRQHRGALHHRR